MTENNVINLDLFKDNVIRPITEKAKRVLKFMHKLREVRDKPLSNVLSTEFGRLLFDNILQTPYRVFMETLFGISVDLGEVAEAKKYGFLGNVKIKNTTYYKITGYFRKDLYGKGEYPFERFGLAYLYEEFLESIVQAGERILNKEVQVNDEDILEYIKTEDSFKLLLQDIREINEKILLEMAPRRGSIPFVILAIPMTPYYYLKQNIEDVDILLDYLECEVVYKPHAGEKREDYKLFNYKKNGIGEAYFNFIVSSIKGLSIVSAVLLNPNLDIGGYSCYYQPEPREDLKKLADALGFKNAIKEWYSKILFNTIDPMFDVERASMLDIYRYYEYYPYPAFGYEYRYSRGSGGYYIRCSPAIPLKVKEDLFLRLMDGFGGKDLKISVYRLLDRLRDFLLKKVVTLDISYISGESKEVSMIIRPFW